MKKVRCIKKCLFNFSNDNLKIFVRKRSETALRGGGGDQVHKNPTGNGEAMIKVVCDGNAAEKHDATSVRRKRDQDYFEQPQPMHTRGRVQGPPSHKSTEVEEK